MKTASFLLCLVAIATAMDLPEDDERIVNGVKIQNIQAAYIVRVVHVNGSYCGGSLVAPSFVVSAAHCFHEKTIDGFTIIANVTEISEYGIRRKISKLAIHPEYNYTAWHSDVAVAQLNAPLADTPPIELCSLPLNDGDKLQVSGWGRVSADKRSTTLRSVVLPVRSKKVCDDEYKDLVKKNMFCASGLKAKAACNGDSGGPAVFNKQLCGVVAFGNYCGVVGSTGVFTDIYAVKPFIRKFIWLNTV